MKKGRKDGEPNRFSLTVLRTIVHGIPFFSLEGSRLQRSHIVQSDIIDFLLQRHLMNRGARKHHHEDRDSR